MRAINRCLNSQLLDLCRRIIHLDELNCKMIAVLPTPLNENCSVAAFTRGCLLITAKNAAWATELRYLLPELRDQLRKEGLYQLSSIKITLPEQEQLEKKKPAKTKLSTEARSSIQGAAKLCSYQPLRDALNHLAGEGE
ncbi:MAG: DUF721 domain-containing protein [Tatlockia sp.]|nr:DUF721 domain-containing protein [Tatlockia sp.]